MNEPFFREMTRDALGMPAAMPPSRADRMPRFYGLRLDPDEVLGGLSVAVIGTGSVGRPVFEDLARLQPARLYCVDPGHLKAQSVLTHRIGVESVHAEVNKAEDAARAAKQISPNTRVFYYDGPIETLADGALADADLVIMSGDNLQMEADVGCRCIRLGAPLLHAAVFGPSLSAQLRVFSNRDGEGPCPGCALTDEERQFRDTNTTFSCTGRAGQRLAVRRHVAPTMSVSSLCSLAADLASLVLLRRVLQLGEPLDDCQIEINGLTLRTLVTKLAPRSASCEVDHQPWRVRHVPAPLADATPAELVETSGLGAAGEGVSLSVDDLLFVRRGGCGVCEPQPIGRFARPGQPAGTCARCHQPLYAHTYYSARRVPLSDLAGLMKRPLRQIGAAGARNVLVRHRDDTVLLHQPAAEEAHHHE